MQLARSRRSFSLMEVVIAVAIFSIGVLSILGLLPGLARQGAATAETLGAARLADALRVELCRLAAPGFDTLAARIPGAGPGMGDGLVFIADRAGNQVESRDYLPPAPALPVGERYYLIRCWRLASPAFADDPLAALLALQVQIEWPYSAAAAGTASNRVTTVVSLVR